MWWDDRTNLNKRSPLLLLLHGCCQGQSNNLQRQPTITSNAAIAFSCHISESGCCACDSGTEELLFEIARQPCCKCQLMSRIRKWWLRLVVVLNWLRWTQQTLWCSCSSFVDYVPISSNSIAPIAQKRAYLCVVLHHHSARELSPQEVAPCTSPTNDNHNEHWQQ